MIDCAGNPGKTLMRGWTEEPAKLAEIDNVKNAFFLRVAASAKKDAEKLLKDVGMFVAPGRTEDFGYFTQPMTEKECREICEKLGEAVLGRIRLA